MKTLCMMTSVHPHDDVRIFRLEALPLAGLLRLGPDQRIGAQRIGQ